MAGFMLPDARMQMPELLEGRKPSGPVEIDWGHPLSAELKQCFLMQQKEGMDLVNLVDGSLATATPGQTELSRIVTEKGESASRIGHATDDGWTVHNLVTGNSSDGCTMAVLYRQRSSLNYQYNVIGGSSSGIYAGERLYFIPDTALKTSYDRNANGNGNYAVNHSYLPGGNEWIYSCLTHRNAARRWLVNGNYADFSAVNNQKFTIERIGFSDDGAKRSPQGDFVYLYFWTRDLSDFEMQTLHDNPYQFLTPAGT